MIYYPLESLVKSGITEILIVTGGNKAGDFLQLLGNGAEVGLKHLNYTYQKGEGGIAEALSLAEHWVGQDSICVILGDNLFERSIEPHVRAFEQQKSGARILLKEVDDPERFGVAVLTGDKVVSIEEKPKKPKSNLAVVGVYFYDAHVFEIIKTLEPSGRGELEITDVNNAYIREGTLRASRLEGWWTDAGTHPSLLRASNLVANGGANR
jgi:glucose-1-phosphate thymidylyltransferase